jgi:hypothetical protein
MSCVSFIVIVIIIFIIVIIFYKVFVWLEKFKEGIPSFKPTGKRKYCKLKETNYA